MKIKTSDLTLLALDWAVARVEFVGTLPLRIVSGVIYTVEGDNWNPSTDWAQGGPIIEREGLCLWSEGYDWEAKIQIGSGEWLTEWAETPLIAAMRCYVASKLGDEVEVPEELL